MWGILIRLKWCFTRYRIKKKADWSSLKGKTKKRRNSWEILSKPLKKRYFSNPNGNTLKNNPVSKNNSLQRSNNSQWRNYTNFFHLSTPFLKKKAHSIVSIWYLKLTNKQPTARMKVNSSTMLNLNNSRSDYLKTWCTQSSLLRYSLSMDSLTYKASNSKVYLRNCYWSRKKAKLMRLNISLSVSSHLSLKPISNKLKERNKDTKVLWNLRNTLRLLSA